MGIALGGAENPSVPNWNDIKLSEEQIKAIQANLDALPQAQELASQTNQFNQDQIRQMLQQAIPGFDQISADASQNIASLIRGELPSDVSDAVASSAAGRALGGGYSGSGMGRNLLSRDLGLTSLDLIGRGLTSAQSWMQNMNSLFAPGNMNVTSMFVSPAQMFSATMANQENKWGVQWMKNQIKAMGDPLMTALGQGIGGVFDAAAAYFVGAGATQPSGGGSSMPQSNMMNMSGFGGMGGGSMYGGGGAGDQGPPSWAAGSSGGFGAGGGMAF